MINLDKPVCIYAIQTTGQNPEIDRIIEIRVLKIVSTSEVKRYHKLINPGVRISDYSTSVHGITNEMVSNKPRFEDIAEELFDFIKNTYWTGYNNEHLYNVFLAESFIRSGIEISSQDIHCIDIGNIYKKLNPRRIDTCYRAYTGNEMLMDNQTTTVSDALMEIFISMINKHTEEIGEDASKWEEFSTNKHEVVDFARRFVRNKDGEIVINFAKKKGQIAKDDPSYLRWILQASFPADTKNWARKILLGEA